MIQDLQTVGEFLSVFWNSSWFNFIEIAFVFCFLIWLCTVLFKEL